MKLNFPDASILAKLWRLLAANFLFNSITGSFMLFLPWVALHQTGSWRLAAAAAPLFLAPLGYTIGSFEAGRIGDVHHPRSVLLGCAAVAGAVCLAAVVAPVTLSGGTLIVALLACALMASTVTPFVDGAVARTLATGEDLLGVYAW